VDRRFRLAWKPLRKAPSPLDRWLARHPWAWAFAYASPWILFWLIRIALGEAGILWLLAGLTPVPFGYGLAVRMRWQVENWDTEHPAEAGLPL
jgi:hypothetical protein